MSMSSCWLVLPQQKPARKRERVVSGPATWRDLIELVDITSSDDDFVEFENVDEQRDDFEDRLAPFLDPDAGQSLQAQELFVGAALVRHMSELHWQERTVDDECGAKAGAQPEKQHLAALVAADRLHRGVVQDLH